MVQTDSRGLSVGARVYDADQGKDDGAAIVVGTPGERADQHVIEAVGKTVAECNPEYPDDDPVVEVVFGTVDSLDVGFAEKGAGMAANQGVDFTEEFERRLRGRGTVYSYPASRLRRLD